MSRFPKALLPGLLLPGLLLVGALFAVATAAELGVGRAPLPAEIAAWDIDVRPDGRGLPKGQGSVRDGEVVYQERCASCHGEFGEGIGRWPELAGGQGSLTSDRPMKTIGSFWPYTSTIFDYVRRAMPFGNAQSLTADETYAVVAYLLNLNDVVTDPDFVLSDANLAKLRLPNAAAFYLDDRQTTERAFWGATVCMSNCKPAVHITGRAALLGVTPDAKTAPKVE